MILLIYKWQIFIHVEACVDKNEWEGMPSIHPFS